MRNVHRVGPAGAPGEPRSVGAVGCDRRLEVGQGEEAEAVAVDCLEQGIELGASHLAVAVSVGMAE